MERVISPEITMLFTTVLCFASVTILVLTLLQLSNVRRKTPPGPFGLPVFGNLFQLGDSPHIALSKMAKVYGSVFSIRLGWRRAIVLNSHDVVKEALSKRACHFSSRPPFHSFQIISNGGRSLAFGDFGTGHQRKKKLAMRALYAVFSNVSRFDALAQEVSERLCSSLTEAATSEALDFSEQLRTLVINFAFRLTFGDNLKRDFTLALQSILRRGTDFVENSPAINLLDFFPWLHFALRKQCKALEDSVKELIDFVRSVYSLHRHVNVEEAGVNVAATLDRVIQGEMLVTKANPNGGINMEEAEDDRLDEESMMTLIADVFGAGIDTVSTSLTWALLFILSNPELQHDLQAELKREVGTERLPTLADRARLPLLQATVLETLRKATVIPLAIPHYASEDSSVAGYFVPKGTLVLANLWAVNHDPNYFHRPDMFDPYRFLDENGQVLVAQQAFSLPFSTGGRRCLGATLAKAQLFMFLGCMLQRLDFQLATSKEELSFDGNYGLTLRPRPFKVYVRPREMRQ